jgi:mRNA interferase MazF
VIFDLWDVIVVPFPFTEKGGDKRRPALVISQKGFNENGHTLLAMITTRSHRPWPGDTRISEPDSAGLHLPCIVRIKAFTLDNRLIVTKIGHLSAVDRKKVAEQFHKYLF